MRRRHKNRRMLGSDRRGRRTISAAFVGEFFRVTGDLDIDVSVFAAGATHHHLKCVAARNLDMRARTISKIAESCSQDEQHSKGTGALHVRVLHAPLCEVPAVVCHQTDPAYGARFTPPPEYACRRTILCIACRLSQRRCWAGPRICHHFHSVWSLYRPLA